MSWLLFVKREELLLLQYGFSHLSRVAALFCLALFSSLTFPRNLLHSSSLKVEDLLSSSLQQVEETPKLPFVLPRQLFSSSWKFWVHFNFPSTD